MPKSATLILFVLFGAPVLVAQSRGVTPLPAASSYPQEVAPAASGSSQVVVNTEMHAVLETPLSTRTSQPGDRFIGTIADPVRAGNGLIAIPAGSRVEGEVVEGVIDAHALHGKGVLNLRFRDIVLPNGQMLPLAAVLVSVNNTSESGVKSEEPDEELSPDEGPASGVIFGSPLKGLAVGQLGGGGYVLAKKSRTVDLPARTGVVIRLVQPLSVNPAGSLSQPVTMPR
jgi:hypothetical protein